MFEQQDKALPFITQMMINAGDYLKEYWYTIPIFIVAFVAFCMVVTRWQPARNILDKVSGFKILDSSFYSAEYRAAVVSEDAEKQTEILDAINKLVDNGTAKKIVSKYMKY
jgi:hypothetical protein